MTEATCSEYCKKTDHLGQASKKNPGLCDPNGTSERFDTVLMNCKFCPEDDQAAENKLHGSVQRYITNCEPRWNSSELQSAISVADFHGYSVTFSGTIPTTALSSNTRDANNFWETDVSTTRDITTSTFAFATTMLLPSTTSPPTGRPKFTKGVLGIDTTTHGENKDINTKTGSNINTAAIIGGVLGAIVVLLLTAAAAYLFIRRRRKRRRANLDRDAINFKAQLHGDSLEPSQLPNNDRSELPNTISKPPCYEADSAIKNGPHEMPANEPPAPELMNKSKS